MIYIRPQRGLPTFTHVSAATNGLVRAQQYTGVGNRFAVTNWKDSEDGCEAIGTLVKELRSFDDDFLVLALKRSAGIKCRLVQRVAYRIHC